MQDSSPAAVSKILAGENPNEGAVEKVFGVVEGAYDSIGLMRGPSAPAKRFLFGTLVGSGIVYALKPEFAFNRDGTPRAWALSNPQAQNKTAIPWFLPGLAFGFFSGFMV